LRIGGVGVLGELVDVARPDIHAGATHVIVALPGATPDQRKRAISLAKDTGLLVLTVPSQAELQSEQALKADSPSQAVASH